MTLFAAASLFVLLQQALCLQKQERLHKTLGTESPIWPCAGIECVRKYVDLPDSHYSWHDTGVRLSNVDASTNVSWKGYVLNMTSQKWLTTNEVSNPIQWHTMVVIVPDNLQPSNWANLVVDFGINNKTGIGWSRDVVGIRYGLQVHEEHIYNRMGNFTGVRMIPGETPWNPIWPGDFAINKNTLPELIPELTEASFKAAYLATHTQSVSISLYCALNAVQVFRDDPSQMSRSEDFIKAYSWIEFLKYGGNEPERIMELPVAKAVVRAMDTATAFTASLPSGEVTNFAVTGYSKLGSATWMVGAIDGRVKAIAPMALPAEDWSDNESPPASLLETDPYADTYLYRALYPLAAQRLNQIVDFGHWLDQIKVPVLYVHPTNDIWFDSKLGMVASWLPLLPGNASVLFVRASHASAISVGISGAAAFFQGQRLGEQLPTISHEFNSSSGVLTVKQVSAHMPTSIYLVSAVTCEPRFGVTPRFLHVPWRQDPGGVLELPGGRTWVADLRAAEAQSGTKGCFLGAFVQLEYPGPPPGYDPYQISTPAFVLPQ